MFYLCFSTLLDDTRVQAKKLIGTYMYAIQCDTRISVVVVVVLIIAKYTRQHVSFGNKPPRFSNFPIIIHDVFVCVLSSDPFLSLCQYTHKRCNLVAIFENNTHITTKNRENERKSNKPKRFTFKNCWN